MPAAPRHLTRALILPVVGVLTLAACGDDDDAGSEASPPASGQATTGSVGGATTSMPSADTTSSSSPSIGGSTSRPGVELVDAGAEGQRVRLPGTGEVGQSAATEVRLDVEVQAEGPEGSEEAPFSFRIATEAEIVDVTEAGYVAETTITAAELEEGPPGFDASSFGRIEGLTYRQETSADGTTGSPELVDADQLTNPQRRAFDQYIAQLAPAAIAYPPEPVGPGARWRATQPVSAQGFTFAITYEYELTSVEGDSYQIDITYDQDIDEEVEQGGQTGQMQGSVTGNGRMSGSLTNPLLLNTSIRQDFDVDIESGGEQLEMEMDVRVGLESTGG